MRSDIVSFIKIIGRYDKNFNDLEYKNVLMEIMNLPRYTEREKTVCSVRRCQSSGVGDSAHLIRNGGNLLPPLLTIIFSHSFSETR